MARLRIAAAQSISQPGDIATNIATHCRFIEAAAEAGVNVLVFPELSLTGYELSQLSENLIALDDARLAPLRYLVHANNMIVIVGAPLAAINPVGVHIGAIILFPDGTTGHYCKQHLHPGEEQRVALPGPILQQRYQLGDEIFALAICADILHAKHARSASSVGTTLYLASVLISESGYETDTTYLQRYAEHYSFTALMANHGGASGGYASAGKSAVWSPEGDLIIAAPGAGNYLVIAEKLDGKWSGEALPIEVRR